MATARFEVFISRQYRMEEGPPGATFSGPLRFDYRWRLRGVDGKLVATSPRAFRSYEQAESAATESAETVGRIEWVGPDGDRVCILRTDAKGVPING